MHSRPPGRIRTVDPGVDDIDWLLQCPQVSCWEFQSAIILDGVEPDGGLDVVECKVMLGLLSAMSPRNIGTAVSPRHLLPHSLPQLEVRCGEIPAVCRELMSQAGDRSDTLRMLFSTFGAQYSAVCREAADCSRTVRRTSFATCLIQRIECCEHRIGVLGIDHQSGGEEAQPREFHELKTGRMQCRPDCIQTLRQ